VIKTQAVKTSKYKDLTTEIPCIWNVKTKVIPVMRAAETACKSFRKYLSNIAGKHDIKGLHKRAILGTAHILRYTLMQHERWKSLSLETALHAP
jgi:hypothetical protein